MQSSTNHHNILVVFEIFIIVLGTPLFLYIDSQWLSAYISFGQDISNVIMAFFYSLFLLFAKRRLYFLILIITLSGLFAEIIGSLLLTLYEYRLKNIPLYIPLGHAIIYATIYNICKQPVIWHHRQVIEKICAKFAFIASLMSLLVLKDIGGFICYVVFLSILRFRKKKLFYLSMFVMVYYLEFFGTLFSTWSWYTTLGNHPSYPTTANFPSGIAGIYVLIDLASNSIYFYSKKIKKYLSRSLRISMLGRFEM